MLTLFHQSGKMLFHLCLSTLENYVNGVCGCVCVFCLQANALMLMYVCVAKSTFYSHLCGASSFGCLSGKHQTSDAAETHTYTYWEAVYSSLFLFLSILLISVGTLLSVGHWVNWETHTDSAALSVGPLSFPPHP